ncbi:hypothetical protein [Mycoplasma struthionis]|uniref:Uncharacterized protein n=1 Tax=Mycoplasma struthionis TaxID=538220 RepID=A0A3G8LGP2_9MOLU|nr:hypothetical protein [Mycoplasma struthionis]AZG68465.1 hypothetical protein EGN60_00535 [Mycoplasma struthionis]
MEKTVLLNLAIKKDADEVTTSTPENDLWTKITTPQEISLNNSIQKEDIVTLRLEMDNAWTINRVRKVFKLFYLGNLDTEGLYNNDEVNADGINGVVFGRVLVEGDATKPDEIFVARIKYTLKADKIIFNEIRGGFTTSGDGAPKKAENFDTQFNVGKGLTGRLTLTSIHTTNKTNKAETTR